MRTKPRYPEIRDSPSRSEAETEKGERPEYPEIHYSRSGARYVRAIDIIRSKAGRRELDLQLSTSKYRNKKTEVDGIMFASKKEANRYGELKLMERAGIIAGLNLQVPFVFEHEGVVICRYYADFQYYENRKLVVEDVKGGKRTKEYIIKKKLMRAFYGIEILET